MKLPTWSALALLVATAGCAAPDRGATDALPDDGFVDVRGLRAAYRVIGSGPGVPVILIHGGPGSTSCGFANALDALPATRPVVIYDQVGSGFSSRIPSDRLPEFTDFGRFLEEIDALRAELGLDEVHLVGSSWGSAVALEYLLEGNATGVQSVSFVGPYFSTQRWIADTGPLVETLSDSAQVAVAQAVASGDFSDPAFAAADAEFMANYGVRTPADQRDPGACDLQPEGNSGLYEFMWGPSEFVSTGTLRGYDRIARLSELQLPVLFVRGEFDEPSVETVLEYQSMVPGSRFETIAGAGHGVYVDDPVAFNRVILEFLESTTGG